MFQPEDAVGSVRHRYAYLDVLRGLVIVLMALDHVRGFIAPLGSNPTDFEQTSELFFLVRWVTHLCAPTFVFLMGVSAFFRYTKNPEGCRRFLIQRGFWLIALEVSWVSFSWGWDVTHTYLGVLWALGGSMILLAALVGLPSLWVGVIGGAVIVGLEVLAIKPDPGLLQILFQPGSMVIVGHKIGSAYPLLPWFGVAALGWGLAPWLIRARQQVLAVTGTAAVSAFALYRGLQWTDPDPWAVQTRFGLTVADFLNPSKYPPSLCFVLLTLGVALLILAGPARRVGPVNRMLTVFGRVPMFFYLLHLPLAHGLGNGFAWWVHGVARVPATEPVSIATILVSWAVVLGLLWPICVRWDRLKRRRQDVWWLRYL